MISDEERRKVAGRLLAVVKKLGPNMDAHEFAHYTADVLDVDENMTWYEMELRLADLIEPEPERTCRMEYAGEVPPQTQYSCYFCSECGSPVYNDTEPSYCPYCGAKVVRDGN